MLHLFRRRLFGRFCGRLRKGKVSGRFCGRLREVKVSGSKGLREKVFVRFLSATKATILDDVVRF